MEVIVHNGERAVVLLERGEKTSTEGLARRLFPAGEEIECERYCGAVELLFFYRRPTPGLRFADFEALAEYLFAFSGNGVLYEHEGGLCLRGEISPAGREFGTALSEAACARVREWGRRLGGAEGLRRALGAGKHAAP